MRVFDTEEKAIIRKITEGSGYSRNLINIIDSMNSLQATRIQIDKKSKKAKFLFQIQNAEPSDEECSWGIEKQKQIIELLIKHVTLLRYLEKEELAIFFEPATSTEQTVTFGMGAVNMPSFSMSIDDQNVTDLLIQYVHKEIMPSPSLRVLESNKYISDEEIKFKKQFTATWIAIIVSIFLGLYGMYNNHQNSISQEKQFKTQLIENNKIAESIAGKLDQLGKSKIDYRQAIDKISAELSKITDRVDLMPRSQAIKVKLMNEGKPIEK